VLRWPTSDSAADDAPTLSEEQMQAGVQLHQLLNALAKQKPKERAEAKGMRRFLPPIDDDRRNQVFLLDGARGSGKTALLVTLLDLWNALALGEALKEGALLADRKAKLDGWCIDPHAWPVVPVGMLDLQPLPAHTPVLLRIVECLARVVEAVEGDTGIDSLMRSIVAGWDHASPERWGRLDPEQSFHELDRAVRDYRDLPSRFDAFVGDLTKDFKKWRPWQHGSEPLFVLAIDDADMVPERAAEALDALRLLYHPRVAFLLTGDSGLFYLSREEAVTRVLRSPRSGNDTSAPSPTRDPFASGLARDIYDKVIPPSHRCTIPSIPANRRAGLVKELSALRFPESRPDGERVSLGWFLEHPLVSEALPDRLRALREVALVGRRFSSDPSSDAAVVRVGAYLWDLALTSPRLASAQRVQLDGVVQRGVNASSLRVAAHDPNPGARLVPRRATRRETVSQAPGVAPLRLSVFLEQDHVVAPPSGKDDGLPAEVLGALVLADNVAFESGQRRTHEATSDRSGFAPFGAFACYEWLGPSLLLRFAWPLPWERRLLDLCNFCLGWDRLPEFEGSPEGVDRAARWFVTLWARLAPTSGRPRMLAEREADRAPPTWAEIAALAAEVAEETARWSDEEGRAYQVWARVRVLLLAAPESGLAPEHAGALLGAFKGATDGRHWDTLRERARVERAQRAERTLGVKRGDPTAADLLGEIDARSVGHPWHAFINEPASQAVPDARELTIQQFTSALRSLGPYQDKRVAGLLERLQALGDVELRAADDISRMVGTVAKDRNETADLLRGIWLRAVLASNGDAAWASYVEADEEGRPQLQLPSVRFDESVVPRGTCGPVLLRDAGSFVLLHDGTPLPPLLQFLFPLVWDWVEGPSGWNTWRTPFASSPWTYRVSHALTSHGIDVPWPSTPWNHFFKYEVERRYWNDRLDNLLAPRGYDVRESRAAENAALYFLGPFCSYLNPEESALVTAGGDTLRQASRPICRTPALGRGRTRSGRPSRAGSTASRCSSRRSPAPPGASARRWSRCSRCSSETASAPCT
jgi:hypothetical protein